MTDRAGEKGYTSSGLDALEHGRRRFELVQSVCDQHTLATLDALEISPEWRCLEIGAGAGSVARWLAGRVPDGEVVATDLNIAYLPADIENLHPLEHDVRTGEFTPGSFDLIHARAVLEHLPHGREVVLRINDWLRPGGWLVIDEVDFAPSRTSPLAELRRTGALIMDALSQFIGTDNDFGRQLPMLLKEVGLSRVRATYRGHPVGGGGPLPETFRESMVQLGPAMVRSGLTTDKELAELDAWMSSNDVVDIALMTVSAWGQKAS